jgi:hypothetical protein
MAPRIRARCLHRYVRTFSFCVTVAFAYANEAARIDVWASGAAIMAISIAAILAFSDWEEWLNPAWVLVDDITVGAGVHAHQGDAHQYWTGAMVAFVAGLELWVVNYERRYSSGSPRG